MGYTNIDTELVDFMDLIDFTLSPRFVEKWRFKYSVNFVKQFQLKLMQSFSKGRPLKVSTLYTHLTKRCKYSPDQVLNWLDDITIGDYAPAIAGSLTELRNKINK